MHTKLKSYVWYKMFAHFFFTLFEDLDFKCFEDHGDFRRKNFYCRHKRCLFTL